MIFISKCFSGDNSFNEKLNCESESAAIKYITKEYALFTKSGKPYKIKLYLCENDNERTTRKIAEISDNILVITEWYS